MAELPREVKWLELARERRRRIARAVRNGRAVDDPRDAPYAVGFADASLDWLSWNRRFRPVHLLLLPLLVADVVLAGGWRPALLLYPLLGFGFLRLRAPRLRRRVAAAREANAGLAAQLQLPAVSVEMPARAFFRPGSRLRRRLNPFAGCGAFGPDRARRGGDGLGDRPDPSLGARSEPDLRASKPGWTRSRCNL
jgi:hypothetical protein